MSFGGERDLEARMHVPSLFEGLPVAGARAGSLCSVLPYCARMQRCRYAVTCVLHVCTVLHVSP